VTISKIEQVADIFRVERYCLFEVRGRFSPLTLTSLNRRNRRVGFGFVRQIALRDFHLLESAVVITIAVIIGETERKMSLRKIRLQSQRFVGTQTSFVSMDWRGVETVIDPALDY